MTEEPIPTGEQVHAPVRVARSPVRLGLQIVGFLIGIALLAWCVRDALNPDNRAQLERLLDAPPGSIAALVGLTVATLLLNGLGFWTALAPVRRLRVTEVVAVNTLATFLNYLPFKLGAIARIAIHNRRDGVPLLMIGAWLITLLGALVIGVGPLVLVSLWRPRVDATWIGASAALVLALFIACVVLSRVFVGERGLARIHRLVDPLRISVLSRLMRSERFRELHAGFAMTSHAGWFGATVLLRLLDVGVQAARFWLAAELLGSPIGYDQALLVSVAFFLIGVMSPSGMLGLREGGSRIFAGLVAIDPATFAPVPLLVGAVDAVVNLTGAGIAIAYLGPRRLLRGATREP